MSNGNRNTVIVAGIVSMFCFTVAGAVAIAWAIPDGAKAGALIAQLFGALAVSIPAVIGLAVVVSKQGQIKDDVSKLRNGEMEAKVRAALADVLAPHLVDPDSEPQLRRDRAVRDAVAEEESGR